MFEPAAANGQPPNSKFWFNSIPPAFKAREGQWLLVPMYHFIGTEELSLAARGLSELATKPHVAVNCADLAAGMEVEVSCASGTFRLPVRVQPDLPQGVACLSAGIGPLSGVTMPAWGGIERAK